MLPGQRACQSLTKRWLITGCKQSGIPNRAIMPRFAFARQAAYANGYSYMSPVMPYGNPFGYEA